MPHKEKCSKRTAKIYEWNCLTGMWRGMFLSVIKSFHPKIQDRSWTVVMKKIKITVAGLITILFDVPMLSRIKTDHVAMLEAIAIFVNLAFMWNFLLQRYKTII
jgi:hypothetical protein